MCVCSYNTVLIARQSHEQGHGSAYKQGVQGDFVVAWVGGSAAPCFCLITTTAAAAAIR
jgi:hypothetical protein